MLCTRGSALAQGAIELKAKNKSSAVADKKKLGTAVRPVRAALKVQSGGKARAERRAAQSPTRASDGRGGGDERYDVGDGPADVANDDEEENFAAGMRQNAMDYQAHDADQDHKLDFDEFCNLVRDREDGDHTDEELRARFNALDADGSGKVDLHEYVRFSLRDALARSSSRVIDLFKQWDEDGSGEIEKKEFRRAIKAMGFDFFADDGEIDMVFDDFDLDKSGAIDYRELNKQLRAQMQLDASLMPGAAGDITMGSHNKHKLRRRSASTKGTKLAGFALDDDKPVQEQLRDLLTKNAVRVIDLCAAPPAWRKGDATHSWHAIAPRRTRTPSRAQ